MHATTCIFLIFFSDDKPKVYLRGFFVHIVINHAGIVPNIGLDWIELKNPHYNVCVCVCVRERERE